MSETSSSAPSFPHGVEQSSVEPELHGVARGSTDTSDLDYSVPARLPEDDDEALRRIDWHVRMVRRERDELHRLEALYRAEMDRLHDRYAERARIINSRIDWHSSPVESWHRAHPERRTVELPHGTSKLRVPKQPMVFMAGEDNDVVRDWAITAHPEILRGPNVTAVRKVVQIVETGDGWQAIDPATGEVVPGVTVQMPEPTWTLDTDPGSPW